MLLTTCRCVILLLAMNNSCYSEGGKKFYGEDLFIPYLGSGLNSLTGDPAPERKMTPTENKKLVVMHAFTNIYTI